MSTQTPSRHVATSRRRLVPAGAVTVLVGFLRGIALLVSLGAVALVTLGLVLVTDDNRDHTDMWDGLGMVMGLVLMAGGLFVVAAGLVMFFLLESHPVIGASIIAGLGMMAAYAAVIGSSLGIDAWPYVMVGGVALCLSGIVVAVSQGSPRPVPNGYAGITP